MLVGRSFQSTSKELFKRNTTSSGNTDISHVTVRLCKTSAIWISGVTAFISDLTDKVFCSSYNRAE